MSKAMIRKLIHKHRALLPKYGVTRLALFGSYARNENKRNSDIDILVEFKQATYRNYIHLARELEKILKKKVDLVTMNSLNRHIKPYILKEAEDLERI